MKIASSWIRMLAPGLIGAMCTALVVTAGPLDPPSGVIAPSFKTLSEVEPRVAINSTNTPGSVDSVFRITASGSYYLTQNITLSTGLHGIAVSASHVTIDLNGYTITGAANSGYAILGAGGAAASATVRNGRIRNAHAPAIALNADCRIDNVHVEMANTTQQGIIVGERSTIRHSSVYQGASGFQVESGCVIENCTTSKALTGVSASLKTEVTVRDSHFAGQGAGSGAGVNAGDRLLVENCTFDKFQIPVQSGNAAVLKNLRMTDFTFGILGTTNTLVSDVNLVNGSQSAISLGNNARLINCHSTTTVGGMAVGTDSMIDRCTVTSSTSGGFAGLDRCTVIDSSATKVTGGNGFHFIDSNTFTNCRADEGSGDGFNARFGNTWTSCSARANGADGIETSSGGSILNCRLDTNGTISTTGANIRVGGSGSRIEGNMMLNADLGVAVTANGNIIVRNSARGAPTDYSIASGNDVGPIGTAAASTSPWSNIDN